jgi:acetylornithine deacetylase
MEGPGAGSTTEAAEELQGWLRANRPYFVELLADLVRAPTTSPQERLAFPLLTEAFRRFGDVIEQPRHQDLETHPDANQNPYLGMAAADRANLSVSLPHVGGELRTLFSAHVDVVPAPSEFGAAFDPVVQGDRVRGRGAVDTKGNIVMLAAALAFISEAGLRRTREVVVDLVVEEEIGGNGALSSVLHQPQVDEVVVLEPTGLEVFHGHRGVLEFTFDVRGSATHMGGSGGVDAIQAAIRLVQALKELEVELVREARSDPHFSGWQRPVQLNIGAIKGGEWHGSVPERCLVRGAIGFLPRYQLDEVAGMLDHVLDSLPEPRRDGVTLTFDGIHNGAYVGDPTSRLATEMRAATGTEAVAPRAWNVSCDARLYARLLGVPTVIVGCGTLEEAHSSHEQLDLTEWQQGVAALVRFLADDFAG